MLTIIILPKPNQTLKNIIKHSIALFSSELKINPKSKNPFIHIRKSLTYLDLNTTLHFNQFSLNFIPETSSEMFKSLMFKTNPLAEELSKYKQRQMAEYKSSLPKTKKSFKKVLDKNSCESKFINIGNKIVPKYPRSLLKRSLNQSPEENCIGSPEQSKKCTFKINNFNLKNNNFLSRTISPQGVDNFNHEKEPSFNQKASNFSNFQLSKTNNSNLQKQETPIEQNINSTWQRRKQKKNTYPYSQKNNQQPNLPSPQTKKSQKIKPLTTQNELKSTLYQSIDLGNIFEKIQSKIDLSKTITMGEGDRGRKSEAMEVRENCFTRGDSKQAKIIEKLRNQLTSETAKKPSEIMNQFNIKNLIEKKIQNHKNENSPYTSQPEALTSRDPFFPQSNDIDIDTLINSLNYNDRSQKAWMPSTRKKSLVIVIDEKGNIVEEDPYKKLKQKVPQKMHMSSKLPN